MSRDSKFNMTDLVGFVVFLLVLFVIGSGALCFNVIMRYEEQQQNIINLKAESELVREEYNDSTLPDGGVPDIEQGDEKTQWTTNTSVDLFKTTYTDSKGNVTIKSHNGDKVIAPGASNDYIFTIANTGNISLDYTLNLDGVFEISETSLPVYVRLRIGDEWLVGSEDEWLHVNLLGDMEIKRTIDHDKSDIYVFSWQWPYDTDEESDKLIDDLNEALITADEHDTKLGEIALGVNTDFRLNIATFAEVTPDAEPFFGDNLYTQEDVQLICEIVGLCFIGGIALITIILIAKSKKDKY